jgi:ACDE family multidrug resistance protein
LKTEEVKSNSNNSLLRDFNLYLIFSITSFAVMGVSSITPAFPLIIKHFSLTVEQIGYLITSFTLPGILLTPLMGILADRYGRKKILVPSMLLFGVAGFFCTLQTSYENLLIMRFLQGVGASALGTINITLLGDLYEGKERVRAVGYNASVLSISTASFPAIGGMLALIDWSFVFYLPLLVFPFALLIIGQLKTPRIEKNISLKKYLGNVWNIVNSKKVLGLFLVNIMIFIILYGAYLSFLPILMEYRFQSDSFTIGIAMSLMSVTTAICSSQLGRIRKVITSQNLLYLSSVVYILSLTALAFASNWVLLILGVVLFGVAHGFFLPNIQSALVGMAPISERAAFMSINSMVLRIGQTIGPVAASLFYINQSLQLVFLLTAIIALLMIIIIKTMVGKLEDKEDSSS